MGFELGQMEMEDQLALTHACAQGDERAQRKLAGGLLDRIRAISYSLGGGVTECDDYAQMAFIEIIQSVGSFRADSSLQRWADRITVRTVLREIKRTRKRGDQIALDKVDLENMESDSLETELSQRETAKRVASMIHALGPQFGVALQLRLGLGYSVGEIADMMETPYNTVRERLRVGRERLHKLIAEDPFFAAADKRERVNR